MEIGKIWEKFTEPTGKYNTVTGKMKKHFSCIKNTCFELSVSLFLQASLFLKWPGVPLSFWFNLLFFPKYTFSAFKMLKSQPLLMRRKPFESGDRGGTESLEVILLGVRGSMAFGLLCFECVHIWDPAWSFNCIMHTIWITHKHHDHVSQIVHLTCFSSLRCLSEWVSHCTVFCI